MDDATFKHLINRRIHHMPEKHIFDMKYKDKIIEITTQMMDQKLTGSIQDAFETYASECIAHFKRMETPPPIVPLPSLECDKIMFPPKKINTFVTKKNIMSFYEKHNT